MHKVHQSYLDEQPHKVIYRGPHPSISRVPPTNPSSAAKSAAA
jgi:hypothetical protein